jgi:hypothetical protein
MTCKKIDRRIGKNIKELAMERGFSELRESDIHP